LLSAIAMRRALAIAFAYAFLMGAAAPAGAAPIEAPDAPLVADNADDRAGMCDAFDGLAFTFCVAICEARDCDLRADEDERCGVLRSGFARVSRGAAAPCDDAFAPVRAL
jgi:hypothetical protein